MGILEDLERKGSMERVTNQPVIPAPPEPQDHVRKRQQILAGRASAEAEANQFSADSYRGVLKTLPDVGGTAGSLFGPIGAGVGAGLGETAYQGAKAAVGEGFDAKAVGLQAGSAAAGQKLGQLGGQAIGKVGGVITGKLRQRAVERATAEYAKATQAGVTAPAIALTDGIPQLLRRAGAAGQKEVDHILDEYRNFMGNKSQDLTPMDLHEIRQVADEIAQPFYNAVGKFKAPPEPALAAKARFYKQVADNARNALRDLVPEATKHEKAASRAITARKFIPIGNPGALGGRFAQMGMAGAAGAYAGGVPGGAAASLVALGLSQPQVAMALGKMMESGVFPAALGQAGRAVGQASQ